MGLITDLAGPDDARRAVRLAASVVLLLLTACQTDRLATPPLPATLSANSPTMLTAVAGAPATPLPSVIVRDGDGSLMGGVTVTFAVETGGGSITGASTITNGAGVAAVGSWTLGTTAGSNTLTATVGGLTPITFTAEGTAGAPATLVKSVGDGQLAAGGTPVPVAPAVTVWDANGNPVPNALVTFTVVDGGGRVTAPQAISSATGVATVGSWMLGAPGTNTLDASAAGVATVTFGATAADPCTWSTPHTVGTPWNGELTTLDCQVPGGQFQELFSVTLASATAYRFAQSSPAFDTYLYLHGTNGVLAAENDDAEGSRNSVIRALLPPGSYSLVASSLQPFASGAYQLSSAVTSTDVTNCDTVFVVRGVSTDQSVQPTDCFDSLYDDTYRIMIGAGETVTISMGSTAVDAALQLWFGPDDMVASNDNRDGSTTDAQMTYTASATGFYVIRARSNVATQFGPYTLTISPP